MRGRSVILPQYSVFSIQYSPCIVSPMLKADHPFSLVLFGASGHLAKIKLFPALYYLALKKRLPESYRIVGYARSETSDAAFRDQFAQAVRTHVPEVNETVLAGMLPHISFHVGQYDDVRDFHLLVKRLTELEGVQERSVRMAYLSIPPTTFAAVVKNMCASGLHDANNENTAFRCIVEKPVGHDLASFQVIREQLFSCFRPDEVYILDHYLGKEAVRNVYYLRYGNPVIERLLKNSLISHVQITAAENQGLDGRAGYFESVGTFRDMFQSHLLQISALLTMHVLSGNEALKPARLEALKKLYLPPVNDLKYTVVQGQYDTGTVSGQPVAGYRQEPGVAADSRTPTFAALKLLSRSSRWEGVPFFLRSGKRMQAKETRITIEFAESMLVGAGTAKNRLEIILQGEAGMRLHLQTKLGGSEPAFRPLIMEDPLVCVGDCLVEHSLLLLEVINGNQQWFLDPDEVQTCWQLLDPLQAYLDQPTTPLPLYPAGTNGPSDANELIGQNGFAWF